MFFNIFPMGGYRSITNININNGSLGIGAFFGGLLGGLATSFGIGSIFRPKTAYPQYNNYDNNNNNYNYYNTAGGNLYNTLNNTQMIGDERLSNLKLVYPKHNVLQNPDGTYLLVNKDGSGVEASGSYKELIQKAEEEGQKAKTEGDNASKTEDTPKAETPAPSTTTQTDDKSKTETPTSTTQTEDNPKTETSKTDDTPKAEDDKAKDKDKSSKTDNTDKSQGSDDEKAEDKSKTDKTDGSKDNNKVKSKKKSKTDKTKKKKKKKSTKGSTAPDKTIKGENGYYVEFRGSERKYYDSNKKEISSDEFKSNCPNIHCYSTTGKWDPNLTPEKYKNNI